MAETAVAAIQKNDSGLEKLESPPPPMTWKEAALKKPELDALEILQEREAEIQKRNMYREWLDEQRRLVKFRENMRKQQERDLENELLISESQLLKSRLQEKTKPYKYRHLLDSTLVSKIGYAQSQSENIARDKTKLADEVDKTAQNYEKYSIDSHKRSQLISSALSHLYGTPVPQPVAPTNAGAATSPVFARAPYSKLESAAPATFEENGTLGLAAV